MASRTGYPKGRLTYENIKGETTEVTWWNPDRFGPGIIDYCGTSDPLTIKWDGDRYGETFASSAAISILVERLDQRQWLEDIFNGGYLCEVRKEGDLFWSGKITPMLGIGNYDAYPYPLRLNANDGLGDTKRTRMLSIDFPEPFDVSHLSDRVTVLKMLLKIISTSLIPSSDYTLYVSNTIQTGSLTSRVLEGLLLDPLAFMDDDDNYINVEDIIKHILGPLHMRMFQYGSNWYIIHQDAQWNKGNVELEKYTVVGGVATFVETADHALPILDLYSCSFNSDYQINRNTQIEFIPPFQGAEVSKEFQMNYNILPAFANRSGNFYSGHDGVVLELSPTPVSNRLRHWTNSGLIVRPFEKEDNQGSVQVPVKNGSPVSNNAYVTVSVDPNLTFDKFFFSCNTIAAYKGEPVGSSGGPKVGSTDFGKVGIKKVFKIQYTNAGTTWNFWRNNAGAVNDPDAFDGWIEDDTRNYVFDYDDVSVESRMPNKATFIGGEFKFYIYECYDDNFYGPDYTVLLSNLKFGITASVFKLIPPQEKARKWYQRREQWKWQAAGEILASGLAGPFTALAIYDAIDKRTKAKRAEKNTGGIKEGIYTSSEIDWTETVSTGLINKHGDGDQSYTYRWGLSKPGVTSFHNLHISSAYYLTGDVAEDFKPVYDNLPTRDLIAIKLAALERDNAQYTTKLTGQWVSPKITPLQLVNDFEGRVYKFAGGTWNDRQNNWNCNYIEFKAIADKPGEPVGGDPYTLTVGDDGTNYGFSDTPPYGAIAPTQLAGEPIAKLATFATNVLELGLGIPTMELLPAQTTFKIHFIDASITLTLLPVLDTYQGTMSGIRDYLKSEAGNTLNIKIETITP